jgi:hypothetical protein
MLDPEAKADFLNMERRWLLLARSYEFGERLDDFTRGNSRQAKLAPVLHRQVCGWLSKTAQRRRNWKVDEGLAGVGVGVGFSPVGTGGY